MKKIKKLSLTKLSESMLDKKQQQLIQGGGCICGSCGQWAVRLQKKVYRGFLTV